MCGGRRGERETGGLGVPYSMRESESYFLLYLDREERESFFYRRGLQKASMGF